MLEWSPVRNDCRRNEGAISERFGCDLAEFRHNLAEFPEEIFRVEQ
jgi:hypothetical protein